MSNRKMVLAAVAQLTATNNIKANLDVCVSLIKKGSQLGAKMVFFPEASDYIAENKAEGFVLGRAAAAGGHDFLGGIKSAAEAYGIWVSVGIHELVDGVELPFNSNVVISSSGNIVSTYRKLHLFNVDIPNGPRLLESASISKGMEIVPPVDTPVGRLGSAICFDMRFPELSNALRSMGAEGISYPSVFTEKTGAAHWDVLLRARAIETQTYVYAAAQIGSHNAKRSSYGNSLIVDPWGNVIARCSSTTKPTIAIAEIDLDYLHSLRRQLPVFENRRIDVFKNL
ncbi:Nitrilase-like protein [Smittium mucronatum]|uniref:Nitrilase-like protein n=1 Tax=Smittium mucronatum TaxID=133383 RepID=A0A1R0GWF9_9FUNG|nr:Nitrilase-like protein [Smittium mucronatum]